MASELATAPPAGDAIDHEEKAAVAVNARLAAARRSGNPAEARAALADAEAVLPTLRAVMARQAVLARPATAEDVALNAAKMIAGYPSSEKLTGGYVRILGEDVLAESPTVGAVEETMRTIRRTLKFAPSVSEVLDRLRTVEHHRTFARHVTAGLPALVAEVQAIVAKADNPEKLVDPARIDALLADLRAPKPDPSAG